MQETNDNTAETANTVEPVATDLLLVAFDVYQQSSRPVKRETIKKLSAALPGRGEKEYSEAWTQISTLFDNACKLAFTWANENPPGAEIDNLVIDQVFLEELERRVPGFSSEQYSQALGYGFENGIF